MKTARNYQDRYKARRVKEKKLLKELERIIKLLFRQYDKITDISINTVSIKKEGKKFVNGLSWSRKDLIKTRITQTKSKVKKK